MQYGLVEEDKTTHARQTADATRVVTATSTRLGSGILRKMFTFAA